MAGLIIIQTMFSIPSAIFFEAFLSFLGIGFRADASLGALLTVDTNIPSVPSLDVVPFRSALCSND